MSACCVYPLFLRRKPEAFHGSDLRADPPNRPLPLKTQVCTWLAPFKV